MIYKGNTINENSRRNLFKRLFKILTFCMILCIVSISVISIIVTYTDVSETVINPFVTILRMFCILLCSIIFTINEKTRGWLKGLVSGGIFCAAIYLLGMIFIDNYTSLSNPIKLFSEGILLGMTGGIIGINLKRK